MSQETGINRRGFLQLALGTGGLWLLRSRLVSSVFAWPRGQSLLSLRLTGLFKHGESAKVIGREYLRHYAQEADEQILLGLISSGFTDGPEMLSAADDEEISRWLRRQIGQDFEAGHVVKLEGWILSATEARLCALVALVN